MLLDKLLDQGPEIQATWYIIEPDLHMYEHDSLNMLQEQLSADEVVHWTGGTKRD